MNREERRHPKKQKTEAKPPQEANVRAKSSRHKKSTADKWNQ
jgi:hypothetical protein